MNEEKEGALNNSKEESSFDYPEISKDNLLQIQNNIHTIYEKYPDAAIVGGSALRIWSDILGRKIPEVYGRDVDIVRPKQQEYEFDERTEAGHIDISDSEFPITEPFFTDIEYNNEKIKIISIEHMLVMKMRSIKAIYEETDKIMKKDIVYYNILQEMVDPANSVKWENYISELLKIRSDLDYDKIVNIAKEITQDIDYCLANNKITEAVHPPDIK